MKPFGASKSRAVSYYHVQDAAAGAGLNGSTGVDSGVDRGLLARFERVQTDKLRAILVRPGDSKKQIADCTDTPRCKQCGTPRPDSFDELDFAVEPEHLSSLLLRRAV